DFVVHDAVQPGDVVGAGHAFVLGLVGQHRPRHRVADGIDARHVGGEVGVHLHAAALVNRHADLVEVQAVKARTATNRHQHHVALDFLGVAALGRLHAHHRAALLALVVHLDRGHLGAGLDVHALTLEDAAHFLRHFAVHGRQQAIEVFHHGHLGA